MIESRKIKCLCGKTLRASVGGSWVNEQWLCGECLVKFATRTMKLEERLRHDVKVIDVKLKIECGKMALDQITIAYSEGKRDGLKFVLSMLKQKRGHNERS